jgi:hypothetical protein
VRQSSADLRLPARPASGAVGAGQGAVRIPGRRAGAPGRRRGSRMRAFRVRGVAGPAEAGAGRCRVRWAAGRQPGAPMPMGVGGPRVWARAAAAPVRAVRACRAPRVWCARVPDQSSGRGARLPGPGSRARAASAQTDGQVLIWCRGIGVTSQTTWCSKIQKVCTCLAESNFRNAYGENIGIIIM